MNANTIGLILLAFWILCSIFAYFYLNKSQETKLLLAMCGITALIFWFIDIGADMGWLR